MGNLGELIKMKRKERGWTQRELAQKVGLANSIISKVEAGKQKSIRKDVMEKLANILGLDVAALSPHGLSITTDPWGQEEDYLVFRLVFELTNFTPSGSKEVWIILGHLLNPDWRIRSAALTSLFRAKEKYICLDIIQQALLFEANNDSNEWVKMMAGEALKKYLYKK